MFMELVSEMDIVLVLGAFGAMLAAFYKMIGTKDAQSSADREADREERQALTEAIRLMAKSSEHVANATVRAANEAKERNGHLGEQNVHIASLVSKQNNDVVSIRDTNRKIANILSKSAIIAAEDRELLMAHEQHIDRQIVEHQHIDNSTVDEEIVKNKE